MRTKRQDDQETIRENLDQDPTWGVLNWTVKHTDCKSR